jgi:hypothetical protein
MTHTISVYLEVGSKRVMASAADWPGWCRGGKDADAALRALLDYGPRYQRVVGRSRLGFKAPASVAVFDVTERLKGNATTDYGVPGLVALGDHRPLTGPDLKRLWALLKACWRALDTAVAQSEGHVLRTGPRGGGRSTDGIFAHVVEAEGGGYLTSLGGKAPKDADREALRATILATLEASARGEIDPLGPRGGKRWPARYFVRRAAWHVLDHVWEIEDRRAP